MDITPYHAKYFAHELTRRYSSDSLQKLAASLSDAQVDLNPHQVEAAHAPKLLLTATPLQNTLMELYGLVSIIDDYTFGDLISFKNQFARLTNNDNFDDLKERLKPICKRTLRRQVLEYVKYTNRIPITQEFYPTENEQRLYDLVSEYLQRQNLYAFA
jgi:SNF2 family DNA or RNA helicase